MPKLRDLVKTGQRDGTPRPEATLGFSASQTKVWALHSAILLSPLLDATAQKEPAWLSWLAHIKVVHFMCLDEYSMDED